MKSSLPAGAFSRGLTTLIVAECALAAAIWATAAWAMPTSGRWWLLTAVVVLTALLLPLGSRRTGLAVLGWRRLTSTVRSATGAPLALPSPCQFRRYDIGFCWQAPALTTVLAIDLPPSLSTLDTSGGSSTPTVDLAMLVGELRRYDIALESLNLTVRSDGPMPHPVSATYWQMVGPLAAVPHRTAWLTLSMTSQSCPEAIARRGGGVDGLVGTLHTATRRVQHSLCDKGFRCHPLTVDQIRAATRSAIPADPRTVQCHREAVHWPGGHTAMFAVDPEYPQLPGTTTSYLLSASGVVDAVLRIDSPGRQSRSEIPTGATALAGSTRDALARTIPGLPGRPLHTPCATASWGVHVGGCGQIIGANGQGQALAVPLAAAGQVPIAADLVTVQALVLRAVATGTRVLIRSDRPDRWTYLATTVGDPRVLNLQPISAQGFDLVVYDGIPPQSETANSFVVLDAHTLSVAPSAELWLDTAPDGEHLQLHHRDATGTDTVAIWPVMSSAERRILQGTVTHSAS